MNKRRVVITGVGVISPIGTGKEEFFNSLKEGKSGIDVLSRFDTTNYNCKIAGEVKDFEPAKYIEKKEARRMDRFAQFAVSSAKMAIEDSKLNIDEIDSYRFGVCLGAGVGGVDTLESQHDVLREKGANRISPFFVPMFITNMAAGNIAIAYNAKGPNTTIVTACASSTNAIGEAFKIIKHGYADIMIAGGTEAPIYPLTFAGFCAMKAMSTRNDDPKGASRPFDKDRNGFVMGEGSGALILEDLEHALKRNAEIYAEVVGYGVTCDAHHITAPAPNGDGAYRSMTNAMLEAEITPKDIDYINAHGTSTDLNDKYETMAIKTLMKDEAYNVHISSTKSMTGHLLGAAGAIEIIACLLPINEGIIPPTINYTTPDEECDLNYVPNKAIKKDVKYALSNSLGFGGHNASLMLKKYE